MADTQLASEDRLNNDLVLDFEQRQRASAFVAYVLDYPESTANELIYLRDRVRGLEKGEFICTRCGLRKDGETGATHDF